MGRCIDKYKIPLESFIIFIKDTSLSNCEIYIYNNVKKFGASRAKGFEIIDSFIIDKSGELCPIEAFAKNHSRQLVGMNLYFPMEISEINYLFRGYSFGLRMGNGTKEKWKYSGTKSWELLESKTTWLK